MDRTLAGGYVDIGGGRRGFRDRDLTAGVRGTEHRAADRNAVQEEILAAIEAAGLSPSSSNWTQLLAALRIMFCRGFWTRTTAGVYSFTVPDGVTKILARGWGAGAGGGGAATGAAAGAGSSGAYGIGVYSVTPGQVIAVTVGSPGVGGSVGANGTGGGTTSIGSLLSIPGGGGGLGVSSGFGATGSVATPSGGAANWPGNPGGNGIQIGSSLIGGGGAPAPFSSGASLVGTTAGATGYAPGGGGGGGANNNTGGAGAPGAVEIMW